MKYLSLFSGIGAFEKALENLEIPFDLVGYCENDKYASKAYSLMHGVAETLNLGDITKANEMNIGKVDLVTYGFPCQDISVAGTQKGLFDETGNLTRSGLFFHALRIIKSTKPKIAIAENVKNLTSKRFKEQFHIVLKSLENAGYNNYWAVLNAKDFGVPQNRERVYIVSIRKDLDNHIFSFPKPYELKKRLKDVLEDTVDDKYYVSDAIVSKFIEVIKENIQTTQTDRIIQIGNCKPTRTRKNPNQGRVYNLKGIAPTIQCYGGGNREPHIIVPDATKRGYTLARDGDYVNLAYPKSKTRRGRVGKQVSQALLCNDKNGTVENQRIRKLTPLECFRLMGFDDEDYEILQENKISNTQLYKMAGNSIVVDVLEELFCMLFDEQGNLWV